MDAAPGETPGFTAGVPSQTRPPQVSPEPLPWENLPPGMIPPAPAAGSRSGQTPTPPPPFGQTPTPPHGLPAVDRNGMPLPRRVDQIDINAHPRHSRSA